MFCNLYLKMKPSLHRAVFIFVTAICLIFVGNFCKADEAKDDWHLILVNKQNPIPNDYEANLVDYYGGRIQVDERIVDDLDRMIAAANEDGVNLYICSAYRSYDRQTGLFKRKVNSCSSSTDSYLKAYSKAAMSVAPAGCSEHQLGLALDIVSGSYSALNAGFGDTQAGKWLNDNAPDYGFILRYPKGKEDVTGIIYEPWHFRYVGQKYSKEITDLGITLEEYIYGDY